MFKVIWMSDPHFTHEGNGFCRKVFPGMNTAGFTNFMQPGLQTV